MKTLGFLLVYGVEELVRRCLLPIELDSFSEQYALTITSPLLLPTNKVSQPVKFLSTAYIVTLSKKVGGGWKGRDRSLDYSMEEWSGWALADAGHLLRFYILCFLLLLLFLLSALFPIQLSRVDLAFVIDSTVVGNLSLQSLTARSQWKSRSNSDWSKLGQDSTLLGILIQMLPSYICMSMACDIAVSSCCYSGNLQGVEASCVLQQLADLDLFHWIGRVDNLGLLAQLYHTPKLKVSIQEMEGKLTSVVIPSAVFILLHSIHQHYNNQKTPTGDGNNECDTVLSQLMHGFSGGMFDLELFVRAFGLDTLGWYYLEASRCSLSVFASGNASGKVDVDSEGQPIGSTYATVSKCNIDKIFVDQINYPHYLSCKEDYSALETYSHVNLRGMQHISGTSNDAVEMLVQGSLEYEKHVVEEEETTFLPSKPFRDNCGESEQSSASSSTIIASFLSQPLLYSVGLNELQDNVVLQVE